MASWKENRVVGIVAGVILLVFAVFIATQVNQNVQKDKKIKEELKRWQSIPQKDKVPR